MAQTNSPSKSHVFQAEREREGERRKNKRERERERIRERRRRSFLDYATLLNKGIRQKVRGRVKNWVEAAAAAALFPPPQTFLLGRNKERF